MPVMPPTHRPRGGRMKREARRDYDRDRGSAADRGYDARWQRAAKAYLAASPLCRYCEAGAWGDEPRITPATLVDHFHPHRGDMDLFWSREWWVADRVRMKSKSTFDNLFIHNHTEGRVGWTTVQDGDEFSTEPEHAEQLDQAGMAEKISGDVSATTERQAKLKGAQVSGTGAIITNRAAPQPAQAPASAPAKPAA